MAEFLAARSSAPGNQQPESESRGSLPRPGQQTCPILEITNLQAGYGHLRVIWDVSLNVEPGEFVVLLGPNGAGKTTLLRVITAIIQPSSGEVRFMGKPVAGLSTDQLCRLGISFITEESNLFIGMSVLENLMLGAYTIGDREQARELLEYVFGVFPVLRERQTQLAGTLSGGERKMLAIARGLMANPKLLLIDEPSLGLAPMVASAVFEVLTELHAKGNTILLVEQNVRMSLGIAQRGYVLEQGRIALQGSSSELRSNPYVRSGYLGFREAIA